MIQRPSSRRIHSTGCRKAGSSWTMSGGGAWQEWLGPEDLRADLGSYRFEAIIPEQ